MSSSRYTTNGQSRSTYYGTSSDESLGLPGDEFRSLRRRQDRNRLENHFGHIGSSNYSRPLCSPYQDVGLSHDERVRISEVKNATRIALGPSFDFTDESCNRATRSDRRTGDRRGGGRYEEPIPQNYLDEFNEKWREDDEKYGVDQYRSDYSYGAQWRMHDHLDVDAEAMRPSTSYRETSSHYVSRPQRVDRATLHEHEFTRRPLVSKFSFDSEMRKPKRKRVLFGFFR